MNMEIIITFIAAIGGLAGLVTAISTIAFKIYDYKRAARGETWEAKLDEKLSPLLEELKARKQENHEIKDELHEIRLDTTRTQLIMLMEHQPHNHDTILKVAERYFCHLKGDWYLTSLFKDWAKKEDVEIPAQIYHATQHHE